MAPLVTEATPFHSTVFLFKKHNSCSTGFTAAFLSFFCKSCRAQLCVFRRWFSAVCYFRWCESADKLECELHVLVGCSTQRDRPCWVFNPDERGRKEYTFVPAGRNIPAAGRNIPAGRNILVPALEGIYRCRPWIFSIPVPAVGLQYQSRPLSSGLQYWCLTAEEL